MIIEYLVPDKIAIDTIFIEFNEDRNSIRSKIGEDFKEDNQVIQFGENEPIIQRRDIYQNIYSSDNFFFLGYDSNDLLSEVEIHHCSKIKVLDVLFGFEDEVDSVVSRLEKHSSVTEKGEGEYFFKDLKIVIMDAQSMGGEGSSLGYFYCATDVSHLE
jgi:hypothetical protein